MEGSDLLPPEFLIGVKIAAILGFFAFATFVVGIEYKYFKKILGEEKSKKYQWVFILMNMPLFFLFVYIFMVIFLGVRIGGWSENLVRN